MSKGVHKPDWLDSNGANGFATKTAEWTANRLSNDNKRRLRQLTELDYLLTGEEFGLPADLVSFSHSQPCNPKTMNYIMFCRNLREYKIRPDTVPARYNFVGHTHVPQFYDLGDIDYADSDAKNDVDHNVVGSMTIPLSDGRPIEKALIVVPSVGQPRDGYPQTGYAIFDTDKMVVEIVRLDYEVAEVADKMQTTEGFPQIPKLWKRLKGYK